MQDEEKTTGSRKLHARLQGLKVLRDRIRRQLHVVGDEARAAFHGIEPAIDKAEHELTHMAEAGAGSVATTLDEIGAALRTIHDGTKQPAMPPR